MNYTPEDMTKEIYINTFKANHTIIRYIDNNTQYHKIANQILTKELTLLNRETLKINRYTKERIIYIEERN